MATRRLSAREKQILALVVAGLGNQEIADKLSISRFTVRHHIDHILDALEVEPRTRIALALKAKAQSSRAPLLAYRCEPCGNLMVPDESEEADRLNVRMRDEEVLAFRFVCPGCKKAICEGLARIVAQLGGKSEASV